VLAFRLFLALLWLVLLAYTGVVIAEHGMGLLPIFFGAMAERSWPGQFNLDFFFMLMLSGLWVSWRHRFTAGGLSIGLLALFGGAGFLLPYLFVQSFRCQGDVRRLLTGDAA